MRTAALSSAVTVLLDDLQRCGVTDMQAEVPYDWFATTPVAAPAKAAVVQLSPRKTTEKPVEAEVNVADWLHLQAEPGCLLLVAPDEALSGTATPMSRAEYELLCKIINAAGLENTPLGWLRLQHEAADSAPLPPAAQKSLNEAVVAAVEKASPRGVMLLGGVAVRSIFGRGVAMDEARTQVLALPEALAQVTLQASYHPAALLQEPLLKKDAWQDWLSLIAKLRTAQVQ